MTAVTRMPNLAVIRAVRAFALLCVTAAGSAAQTGGASARMLDSIAAVPVLANRTVGLVAAVVRGSDTLLLKAYGKADAEWDVPMPVDAMFEIGSVSKQFAAAAILQLRDAGRLTLDDDITKWLPAISTGGNAITLRHLLTHTSGINGFADADEWEKNMFLPRYPRDSAMRLIKLDPFRFRPGEAQAYSNSGFWLLGLVVEKASGTAYEDYLASRIFEPLGMKRSMFCNSLALVTQRARGYMVVPSTTQRAPMVNYTWVFAPGAICSTAGDLITWIKALHGGKVLSPKSYVDMTTPSRLANGTPTQYGMGIKVAEDYRGLKYIGHGGTAPGFRADALWYPESQMAVVVLMNSAAPNLSAAGVSNQLARAVLPWPRPAFTYYTGDATELVGRYQFAVGGNQPMTFIEVTQTPQGLAFAPNGQRAERLPWAGGLTFYPGENVTLTFRRANGDRGQITELHRDDAGNHYILRKQ